MSHTLPSSFREFKPYPSRYLDALSETQETNFFSGVLQRVFDPSRHQVVADIGCGNGLYTAQLKRMAKINLIGIDGNPYGLEQAKKRGFDEIHLVEDLSCHRLPLEDNSVDLAICKDLLEHLLHPDLLVAEITRIVRPGGIFLVHVPNHFPLFARLKFLFSNNIDTFGYFADADRWEFPHIRFFTKRSLEQRIIKLGFIPVGNFSDACPYFPLLKIGPVRRWLARTWPDQFAEGITLAFSKDRSVIAST